MNHNRWRRTDVGAGGHLREEVLLDYLLGELAACEKQSADAHLERCASCRGSLEELQYEPQALFDAVDADDFPSAASVAGARSDLTNWINAYEDDLVRSRSRKRLFGSLKFLAAAASIMICLGILLLKMHDRAGDPDPHQVLAKARLAEEGKSGGVLFQSFRVEIAEVQPRQVEVVTRLESWSDSTARRFASRWLDTQGTVKHAVWRRSKDEGVLAYDASYPARIAKAPLNHQPVSLLDLGESGLSCDDLAAGLVRWLEARSWSQQTLSGGILSLTDRQGIVLQIQREQAEGRDVIGLSARRQTSHGIAEVLLIVSAGTYEPESLRVRFHSGQRVSELRLLKQEFRHVVSVDRMVFEPTLPGWKPEIAAGNRERAPRREVAAALAPPAPESQGERLAAEIRIRYALHQAGACLGEPIRIEEQGEGELLVAGIAPSEQMKARILDQLQKAQLPPWVKQDIATAAEAAARARTEQAAQSTSVEPEIGTVTEPRLPLQKELLAYFSSHPLPPAMRLPPEERPRGAGDRITVFTNQAVILADDALDEAWALRRLAERYGAVDDVDPASTVRLQGMIHDHLAALREDYERFQLWVAPVLKAVASQNGSDSRLGAHRPADHWPGACLEVFRAVERTHQDVMALLAVNFNGAAASELGTTAPSPTKALSGLLRALEGMESTIEIAGRETTRIRGAGVASSGKGFVETSVP